MVRLSLFVGVDTAGSRVGTNHFFAETYGLDVCTIRFGNCDLINTVSAKNCSVRFIQYNSMRTPQDDPLGNIFIINRQLIL